MKRSFYLFNPGRLSRKDNTLKFEPKDENGNPGKPRFIPVENVGDLYVFGSLDANSEMYNFLAKNGIAAHFFDYYEHYTGSFMPKDYLNAGQMVVKQSLKYHKKKDRIFLARQFVDAAAFNMLKNLRYYQNRGKEVTRFIEEIESYNPQIEEASDVQELMGIEGNIRQLYYQSFDEIMQNFSLEGRSKQPPENELNALISFGNMMCYTTCLGQIYHTQLNPTVSFLHEPGYRRYSLALDIAELFKPLLVDRTIFRMVNKGEIKEKDFDKSTNYCTLKGSGKKNFVRVFEERLQETIQHRSLNKKVSYKHLIRLECYKLAKHVLDIEEYKPLKFWW